MERCTEYFIAKNARFLLDRIHVFAESSATVELAAACLNCRPCEIAKSLSFLQKKAMSKAEAKAHTKAVLEERRRQQQQQEGAAPSDEGSGSATGSPAGSPTSTPQDANVVLIVAAGDAKVNAKKYKEKFLCPPKMLKRDEVEALTGFPPGGVCPFGVNDNVKVYLDVSLRRFSRLYPAMGTSNTVVGLSVKELETYASNFVEWVDLCEGWQENQAAAVDNDVAAKKAEHEAVQASETSA